MILFSRQSCCETSEQSFKQIQGLEMQCFVGEAELLWEYNSVAGWVPEQQHCPTPTATLHSLTKETLHSQALNMLETLLGSFTAALSAKQNYCTNCTGQIVMPTSHPTAANTTASPSTIQQQGLPAKT